MWLLKWLQKKTYSKVIRSETISPVAQEDQRTMEAVQRTRKAFAEQRQQMQTRALKAHAADCPDPWTCTKSPCFVWIPDKIIGKPEVVRLKTKEERSKQ